MADFIHTGVVRENKPSDQLFVSAAARRDTHRVYNKYDLRIPFKEYLNTNLLKDRCVSVPIFSINEITPEMVYDFTTHSNNHSFVASSFVTHNCAVETPEGQSIGVVKTLVI
jgi:hypothetical protein